MANSLKFEPPSTAPSANYQGTHRANHVGHGHVGRVSYFPLGSDDDDLGELQTSRNLDSEFTPQELLPPVEWYPATKFGSSNPVANVPNPVRQQKHWLLRNQPEAYLADACLDDALREELQDQRNPSSEPSTRPSLPLLSVGHITDVSDPFRRKSSLALASAVGASAHVLRVTRLRAEDWNDALHASPTLRVRTADATEQGYWCDDMVPIRQIKFAGHTKSVDPIRWLLLQKTTSTVVFEPEANILPIAGANELANVPVTGLPCIDAKPIISWSLEDTDGQAHCDVSLKPSNGIEPHQIIILDDSGLWRIWTLEGSRRSSRYKTLKMTGDISPSIIPHFLQPSALTSTLRAIWASQAGPASQKQRRQQQQQQGVDFFNDSDREGFDEGGYRSQQTVANLDAFILCGAYGVQIHDSSDGRELCTIALAQAKKNESLLDVHVLSHDPSKVFVLTTTTLYLIEIRQKGTGRANKSPILMSCSSRMNTDDRTAKLTLSPARRRPDGVDGLVAAYSSQNMRINLFWFSLPVSGQVNACAATIKLIDGFESGHGIQALHLLPVQQASNRTSGAPRAAHPEAAVYQFITVGADLGLTASIWGWSDTSYLTSLVQRRQAFRKGERKHARRRLLKLLNGDVFVVLDEIDASLRPDATASHDPRPTGHPVRSTKRLPTINVDSAVQRLFQMCQCDIEATGAIGAHSGGRNPFDTIKGLLSQISEERSIPLATLLELGGIPSMFDVGRALNEWPVQAAEVAHMDTDRIKAREIRAINDFHGLPEMLQSFHDLWTASLPHQTPEAYRARNSAIGGFLAVQVFLSQVAIAVLPARPPPKSPSLSLISRTAGLQMDDDGGDDDIQLPALPGRSSPALSIPRRDEDEDTSTQASQETVRPDDETEDGAVTRLRMYCPTIKSVPPRAQGPTRLLSHWELGKNPWEYSWIPDEEKAREMAELNRRRQQEEDRRRRRAEKLRQLKAGARESQGEDYVSSQTAGPPSSIMMPGRGGGSGLLPQSSQIQPPPSSQIPSSQTMGPSQAMSQPTSGTFGKRAVAKKKKPKAKGGFR